MEFLTRMLVNVLANICFVNIQTFSEENNKIYIRMFDEDYIIIITQNDN